MTKLEILQRDGEIITSEKGNSMLPLIKSGQKHKLKLCTWEECEIKDIVYAKCNGKFYTHLVYAKNDVKGVQIGNNKGFINGWTKTVYGKVIEIY
jgi:hypothetical protein